MTSIMSVMPSLRISYVLIWLILKHNKVFKMLWMKQCDSLKETKPSWEEILGPVACEPEHDSQVVLILLAILSFGIYIRILIEKFTIFWELYFIVKMTTVTFFVILQSAEIYLIFHNDTKHKTIHKRSKKTTSIN